ncbi:hypothetical protein NCS52_01408500 [Fusarium sp. LHS14.1]|nr:hypothetical protein NCS52_01408500 [Fusarium sp. LHS14.1]
MTDLLRAVPRDVFLLILEALPKADLKTLSQTSSWLQQSVASTLWKSITIKPRGEYLLHDFPTNGLPYRRLRTAIQLHLRASFARVIDDRCPHIYDYPRSARGEDEDENYDEPRREFYFDDFADKVESLLHRMEPNQLQSFRQDLGTCIPVNILGTEGILSLQQPSIQTLRLITDPNCLYYFVAPFKYEPGIDLSSFRQLLNLSWKGPRPDHMQPLSVVLSTNSAHLRSLELDFVNLPENFTINDSLCYDDSDVGNSSDDQDDGISSTSNSANEDEHVETPRMRVPTFSTSTIFGVDPNSPTLLFPMIRVLSLSQVPLGASMAPVFNFETLISLKLRLCPRWEVFIKRILKLNCPIKLKTLEIQDHGNEDIILDLVDAFEGLEELFLSHTGPVSALQLWEILARRHATLSRLVCHQRTIELPLDSPVDDELCDLADLSIYGRDMRTIKEDPAKNPLSELDLEFIGLACIPGRVKYLLLPFRSKTSLKAIHIRQTMSDIDNFGSWAFIEASAPLISRADSDASSDSDLTTHTEDSDPGPDWDLDFTQREPELRNEFRHFAEWAFGPDGISSLDIIAFGDFAYGSRTKGRNVFLERNTIGTSNFRILDGQAGKWKDTLDKYQVAMEACPVEHLFTF